MHWLSQATYAAAMRVEPRRIEMDTSTKNADDRSACSACRPNPPQHLLFRRVLAGGRLLVAALFSSFYNVLFGWWLDGLLFRRRQNRFEEEIQARYDWLFEKYGARIVRQKPYRQVFDYVQANVRVDNLTIAFVRGRGEFNVSVAPAHAPDDWYDFGEAIDLASDSIGRRTFYRTVTFRPLFETNIDRLRHFFSPEQYGRPRRDWTVKQLIGL